MCVRSNVIAEFYRFDFGKKNTFHTYILTHWINRTTKLTNVIERIASTEQTYAFNGTNRKQNDNKNWNIRLIETLCLAMYMISVLDINKSVQLMMTTCEYVDVGQCPIRFFFCIFFLLIYKEPHWERSKFIWSDYLAKYSSDK